MSSWRKMVGYLRKAAVWLQHFRLLEQCMLAVHVLLAEDGGVPAQREDVAAGFCNTYAPMPSMDTMRHACRTCLELLYDLGIPAVRKCQTVKHSRKKLVLLQTYPW
jgi:hypothetical protein